MKAFAKLISTVLALVLLFSVVSCTDKKKDGESNTQSASSDNSDETCDWGLGIVMPEK